MYGIEGETALTAAAEAGDHHQLVARYAHIDVLEVVYARTQHFDVVIGMHGLERIRLRLHNGLQVQGLYKWAAKLDRKAALFFGTRFRIHDITKSSRIPVTATPWGRC